MTDKATCKHCGYQWPKGEDSGHSVEDCRDRLKAKIFTKEELKWINKSVDFLLDYYSRFGVASFPKERDELESLLERIKDLTIEQGKR